MHKMLKIILLSGLLINNAWGFQYDDPISIGDTSFISADWDEMYNMTLSRNTISKHTTNNQAVVLFIFYACMS